MSKREKEEKQKKIKKVKEKKPKKTIRQKMSSLNTTNDLDHGNVTLNPKDKRVKWFFIFGVLAVVATGISVPWALSYKTVKEQVGRDKNDVLFGDETMGGLEDSLNSFSDKKMEAYIKEYQDLATQYMYIQERNAFLKFKAFLENTKYKKDKSKFSPTSFGADLSTPFADIKKEVTDQFYKEKKAYKAQHTDWNKSWVKTLLTDEKYGKPLGDNANPDNPAAKVEYIESKVINYLVSKKIKDSAFARYTSAEIKNDLWTVGDLSLGQAGLYSLDQDIYFDSVKAKITINNDGSWKIEEILSKNGASLKPTDAKLYWDSYLNQNSTNISYGAKLPTDNAQFISVFETKSYLPEFRNPVKTFAKVFANTFKSANISKLSLGFGLDKQNWTFTKDLFLKLFSKYEYNFKDPTTGISSIKQDLLINGIQTYKGTNALLEKDNKNQIDKDFNIKKALGATTTSDEAADAKKARSKSKKARSDDTSSSDSSSNSLGGTKVTKINELLKSDNTDREFNLFALSSGKYTQTNFQDQTNTTDEYKIFKAGNDTTSASTNNIFRQMIKELFKKDPTTKEYAFIKTHWPNYGLQSFKNVLSTIEKYWTIDTASGVITPKQKVNLTNYNIELKNHLDLVDEKLFSTAFTNIKNGLLPQIFKDATEDANFTIEDSQGLPNGSIPSVTRAWTINKLSDSTYLYLGKTASYVYTIEKASESKIPLMVKQSLDANFYSNWKDADRWVQSYEKEDAFAIKDLYASINNDAIISSLIYSVGTASTSNQQYATINSEWLKILAKRLKKATNSQETQNLSSQIQGTLNNKTYSEIFKANVDATKSIYSGESNLIDAIINDKNSYDFKKVYAISTGSNKDQFNSYNYSKLNNGANYVGRNRESEWLEQEVAEKVVKILNVPKKETGVK